MTEPAPTPLGRKAATPVASSERITSLDAIRGVAALGILVMNATSFGLASAGYYNLDADGSDNVLDWTIGVLSMILVDQKMMAIFSLLFGVGVVVFAERAQAKGRRVNWLSMWRFVLLAVFGLLHTLIWEGDVLLLYALCAPIVLALRNRRPLTLLVAGSVLTLLSAAVAPAFQAAVGADGAELGEVWFADANGHADVILGYVLIDGFGRALGLMLIGVALYRWGVVQGTRSADFYRRMVRWGLGVGLPLATLSVVVHAIDGWGPGTALVGRIPNTLATIPVALGYLGLLVLWNERASALALRMRNVGRMALTNYLAQTIIGVTVLTAAIGKDNLSRSSILVFIIAVWALQAWWSTWWLERFRFGPFEWSWRCATYRKLQPLRH